MTDDRTRSSGGSNFLLIHAYLDGELDAASALAVEENMALDPALKGEYDRLAALKTAVAASVRKTIATDAFRLRIARLAAPAPPAPAADWRARTFDLRQMAASIAVTSVLATGATLLIARTYPFPSAVGAIVDGHRRALLSAAPVDVASSDSHTVKPWFDTRIAISPPVPDLAAAGFPLVGGRVEVVDGHAIPTLAYRYKQHAISLAAVPKPGRGDGGAKPSRKSAGGYTALTWQGWDFEYTAVSDMAEDTLREFAARWRAATVLPSSKP